MADKAEFGDVGHTPRVPTHNALVHTAIDPWLVGGAGLVLWLMLTAQQLGGPTIPVIVAGPIYWLLLGLSGTHFGASYHLAYGQGREVVMERWVQLIAVPAGLVLVSFAVGLASLMGADALVDETVRFLLVMVYTTTAWHFVKQVYGVARVSVSLNGLSLPARAVPILRYGLYPLWFLEASRVWVGRRGATFAGFEISYTLLPRWVLDVLAVVAYGAAAVMALLFAALWVNWRHRPPASMWTPYAVGFLFFLFPPSYLSVVLVFGALHGLQYLACAHRAEVVWGIERGAKPTSWWASAFGGAFATGMLLVYWLPDFLTSGTESTAIGTAPAALLFVLFNLHHYAVDATIWRFGGEHIRRIVKGPVVAKEAATEPALVHS